jgi:ribonucleotide reductase beta subunit family protein with ferritin-like domain
LILKFLSKHEIKKIYLLFKSKFINSFLFSDIIKEIGIKYLEDHPKSSPIPWFNKHVNIGKKQTALQENESTNYVIGVMSDNVSYDELPDL